MLPLAGAERLGPVLIKLCRVCLTNNTHTHNHSTQTQCTNTHTVHKQSGRSQICVLLSSMFPYGSLWLSSRQQAGKVLSKSCRILNGLQMNWQDSRGSEIILRLGNEVSYGPWRELIGLGFGRNCCLSEVNKEGLIKL